MTIRRRPFSTGETVKLIVPTMEHVIESSWADWFNDELTTRFTTHGLMPNSVTAQERFLHSIDSGERFALLITPVGSDVPIGIVSLSTIDYRKRSCALAIIMDVKTEEHHSPLAALEAVAIVTSHAFDKLGMKRIDAGQVFPAHERWRKSLELLGYRAEGFRRGAFTRGQQITDEVVLGCRYEVFAELQLRRGGNLWSSAAEMTNELASLPKKSFAQVLDTVVRQTEASYFGESGG